MAASNGEGRILSDCCNGDVSTADSVKYAYKCETCGKPGSVHQECKVEKKRTPCEACGRMMPAVE